jgi:hypothetical protein
MIVDDRVVVENKATEKLVPAHRAQLVAYLKATSAVHPDRRHYAYSKNCPILKNLSRRRRTSLSGL